MADEDVSDGSPSPSPHVDSADGGEPRLSDVSEMQPRNLARDLFADLFGPANGAAPASHFPAGAVSLKTTYAQVRGGAAPIRAVAGRGVAGGTALERLAVALRIRPLAVDGTSVSALGACIHACGPTSIAIAAPESSAAYKAGSRGGAYSFTSVWGPTATTGQVYAGAVAGIVRAAATGDCRVGEHTVVLALGMTAAGKSHTLHGNTGDPGFVRRALDDVFAGMPAGGRVTLAAWEVHHETIYDLLPDDPPRTTEEPAGVVSHLPGCCPTPCPPLAPPAQTNPAVAPAPPPRRPALKVKEDARGRVYVAGLREWATTTPADALEMVGKALVTRVAAATALNNASSRSHCAVTIAIYGAEEPEGGAPHARLTFVDLAGSERASRTGHGGAALRESASINGSLATLTRCLAALRWNQAHPGAPPRAVPYRESKLTHVLRDPLHGWGRALLLVAVSPTVADYDETAHVLRYAADAAAIAMAPLADQPLAGKGASKVRPPLAHPLRLTLCPCQKRPPAARPALQAEPSWTSDGGTADGGDGDDGLRAECARLRAAAREAEGRAAALELAVRAEVAGEMAELLAGMEASYKARLAAEITAAVAAASRAVGGSRNEVVPSSDPAPVLVDATTCVTPSLAAAGDDHRPQAHHVLVEAPAPASAVKRPGEDSKENEEPAKMTGRRTKARKVKA